MFNPWNMRLLSNTDKILPSNQRSSALLAPSAAKSSAQCSLSSSEYYSESYEELPEESPKEPEVSLSTTRFPARYSKFVRNHKRRVSSNLGKSASNADLK